MRLRVVEAHPRDAGRGIVRIDPADLERMGAAIGDTVMVQGERATVAKAMPAYLPDRGKSILQIDGITRENAGASLDATVAVTRARIDPAQSISLKPLTGMSRGGRSHSQYLSRLLVGRPFVAGDRVRVDLVGTSARDYRVEAVAPKGAVIVTNGTRLNLREEVEVEQRRTGVTYEDIGGLHRETQRIREMIELPLKYPEVFERLGIDAPRGVLLYGPPGSGKTLIARAVANETNAHFISIAGPEIIHKFYGESEAHLRQIFEEAEKRAPSIIFLDEIDAIAPKREETSGDKQVEKRVVAQLLALMDGLKSRGRVIVIGATNIPNTLDPALRRPGRFDRELSIAIPDQPGRLEILEIHTRGMPLADDVDLPWLSAVTHGFVGADLEALCREAAMTALRKLIPNIDFAEAAIPIEQIEALQISMDHFRGALAEVEPSAIREVFTEVPDVSWDDIGGLEHIKEALREAVEWPIQYPDLYTFAGTTPPKGILLSGSPGTGKTLLAKAVARQSGANFISVKGPALMSKWVGESEKGVREIFHKARLAHPCIIFFDEIDALAPTRGAGSSDVTERVLSQMLTEMDGIEALQGVMVLAATNRPDMLDPALMRTGRFDVKFELPVPDRAAREAIFGVHTRRKPVGKDVDLVELAALTEGKSGADIEGVCRRAAVSAIREYLSKNVVTPSDGSAKNAEANRYHDFTILRRHFVEAIGEGD
ncbi:MAG: CDC48 family AAA ATPase [Anaerolineales bacterium]|nr:CDC48 family AAA ATPase [Anaerolineales bacterium]